MEAKGTPRLSIFELGGSLKHSDDTPKPDFAGYATKAGLKCSDGRTITPDAFKHQDKMTVPLVWQHSHNEPGNVLGHAILEHRTDGIYTYGYFNDTEQAKNARVLVEHKDITALSIYANQLTEKAKQVIHGFIREVSLVLSGANPGALIDNITIAHADGDLVTLDDEAIITTGLSFAHADGEGSSGNGGSGDGGDGPTVQEVYDSMSDQQKEVVQYMVGAAIEGVMQGSGSTSHSSEGGTGKNDDTEGRRMSRNVFEQQNGGGKKEEKHELTHDAIKGILEDAHKSGSMKVAVEAYALKHGIENIDILFPDAKNVTTSPEWDTRRIEWVKGVINGTKHSPFTRIRSWSADLTFDDARAKGYIKGTLKKEEFFGVSRRTTTPTTVYKKQKLDRDDILDITDFDVVAWMKGEMRLMMDEELARAILIGDGRDVADEDKIKDPVGAAEGAGIRSILNDHELYVAEVNVDDAAEGTDIVDAIISSMQYYKGSGSPTLYTTLGTLTKILLQRDQFGHRMWKTPAELASEMGVSSIVTVEVMEDETDLIGIIVNLTDYTVGTDKGGDVTLFDDFDIDYNQYKYLLETRLSGALTKIRSAMVVKRAASGSNLATPVEPAFNGTQVTAPTTTGVDYYRGDTNVKMDPATPIVLAAGQSLRVYAQPQAGYYFASNQEDEWTFKNEA